MPSRLIVFYHLIPLLCCLWSSQSFEMSTVQNRVSKSRVIFMSSQPSSPPKRGVGFNYDPSDYRDSNSGNYRRLSDQLAAKKDEDEKKLKEREEILRKERMQKFEKDQLEKRIQELMVSDEVIVQKGELALDPSILKIFEDLDKELIGLKPVKDRLFRYAASLSVNKARR